MPSLDRAESGALTSWAKRNPRRATIMAPAGGRRCQGCLRTLARLLYHDYRAVHIKSGDGVLRGRRALGLRYYGGDGETHVAAAGCCMAARAWRLRQKVAHGA